MKLFGVLYVSLYFTQMALDPSLASIKEQLHASSAGVAKLVDATDLGSVERKLVGVRVPSSALHGWSLCSRKQARSLMQCLYVFCCWI